MSIERDIYRLTCPTCGHEGEMLWEEDDRPLHGGEFTGFTRGWVKRTFHEDKVFGECEACGYSGQLKSALR